MISFPRLSLKMAAPLFAAMAAVTAAFALSGCYKSTTAEGTVVDEQNGQPLAGVVVVAHTQARGNGLDVGMDGQLGTVETITDQSGHYTIPAWGPRLKWFGNITHVATRLLVFKSGYQGQVIETDINNGSGAVPLMNIAWENKTIRLHAAAPAPRPRIQEFDLFNVALRPIMSNVAACPWKQIPAMLREVRQERLALQPHALDSDAWPLSTVDDDLIANADKLAKQAGSACGSPKEVFQLQSQPR